MNEGPTTEKPAKKARRAPGGLRRRHVLIGATAAAGGLALTRVLGLHNLGELPGQTPTTVDWISPLDRPEAQVAHLLRRATFGTTPAEYQQSVKDGFSKTVDRLIETPAVEPPALPGGDDASRDKPIRPAELQTWWVDWMLKAPTPFAERMTFFWHGHFTSDFRKVNGQFPFMYWQNLTWRKMAVGSLGDILYQVTIDPAMLRYLDLAQSTGRNPNENYSRELMELFTMGVGTFSEEDVRSAARALSGWREPITQAIYDAQVKQAMEQGRQVPRNLKPDDARTGVFEQQRSYVGGVKFLGDVRQWDTKSVLAKILTQDSVAPFIVTKVLREFVSDQTADAQVKRLADGFRKSRYDVKTLMRDVFTSPEFIQPTSYRALVKSPIELMVNMAKALEAPALARSIATAGDGMGQSLFDPPEVGGWPSNASWISSNNVLARVNFVQATLTGMAKIPPFKDAHMTQLDGVVSPATAQLLNSSPDDATRWLILLASPEFQLK
ncbi:MAG TPA: DUF1800 domain-containing protein [Candidatus Limnocylindria bacterium]|jgi:uncharacterized protein (DUF1800 family)|nr:DUF1800 domain-containing protein [Candidatus Limnocylindria bacterium]